MKKQRNYLILSLLVVLIATLMPGDGKIAGNYLDKLVHFGIFLFLAFHVSRYYKGNSNLIFYILSCVLLGFLTEILQQYIPGRNMDIYDALADTLGVVVGVFASKTK